MPQPTVDSRTSRTLATTALLCAGIACGTGDRAPSPDSSISAATAPSPAAPAAAPATSPWFRQTRQLDLTSDGIPDSIVLEAIGRRSDSLRIRLLLLVGTDTAFRREWRSADELVDVDSLARTPPGSDSLMRSTLTRVLEFVRQRTLDTTMVRTLDGDTSVLRLARSGPVRTIVFAYGFETGVTLVWDPGRHRFLVAHECC